MLNGIGCDICKMSRVDGKVISKVLTQKEIETYESLQDARKQEWLSGRFAAKEAIIKAVGTVVMTQIEIQSTQEGKPFCELRGMKIHLSISHDGDYAMAMAVAESV